MADRYYLRQRPVNIQSSGTRQTNLVRSSKKCVTSQTIKRKRRLADCEDCAASERGPKRQRAILEGAVTSRPAIEHWCRTSQWPSNCLTTNSMGEVLARKRSNTSIRRKGSERSLSTASDQRPREEKSAPYRDARYSVLLATKGSHMDRSVHDITEESKEMVRLLLTIDQTVPTDSLFRDDLFEATCRKIRDRNETRVIRDISQLIVPSAEQLTTYGAKELGVLVESVNEGWNNSIPVTSVRPQPDYSVGFRREAFTPEQTRKLQPYLGDLMDTSFFLGTYYLHFPFLTCEVKCGTVALDIADRQNAHSMHLAIRGVVELFRLVHREHEINREILAFSVSHDHESVRIYGHYPVFEKEKVEYFRHSIRKFDFTEVEGREKWTAYKFIKGVYSSWMPAHLAKLLSAIDALPQDPGLEMPQSTLHCSEPSGLSQDVASHHIADSDIVTSITQSDDLASPYEARSTPDTSVDQVSTQRKKPRNGRN